MFCLGNAKHFVLTFSTWNVLTFLYKMTWLLLLFQDWPTNLKKKKNFFFSKTLSAVKCLSCFSLLVSKAFQYKSGSCSRSHGGKEFSMNCRHADRDRLVISLFLSLLSCVFRLDSKLFGANECALPSVFVQHLAQGHPRHLCKTADAITARTTTELEPNILTCQNEAFDTCHFSHLLCSVLAEYPELGSL